MRQLMCCGDLETGLWSADPETKRKIFKWDFKYLFNRWKPDLPQFSCTADVCQWAFLCEVNQTRILKEIGIVAP